MRFAFDPVKQASNLRKHGLNLADARHVIESGLTVTFRPHPHHLDGKADRHEKDIYRENFR